MARKRSEWLEFGSGTSYSARVHRPLQCLIFITPLLLIYQIGSALETRIEPNQAPPQVLAFVYLQKFFSLFGATGNYLPLLAVVFILLFWHFARKDKLDLEPQLYLGMTIESLLWAVPIFVIGLALTHHVGAMALPTMQATQSHLAWHNKVILSIGAGLYEELLFRLIAITLLNIMLVDIMELKLPTAIPLMILISAVMFSLYHYMGDENFAWNTFFFRTAAGIYFAGIFIYRGFGIVVGCHAIYDLIVVLAQR